MGETIEMVWFREKHQRRHIRDFRWVLVLPRPHRTQHLGLCILHPINLSCNRMIPEKTELPLFYIYIKTLPFFPPTPPLHPLSSFEF